MGNLKLFGTEGREQREYRKRGNLLFVCIKIYRVFHRVRLDGYVILTERIKRGSFSYYHLQQ